MTRTKRKRRSAPPLWPRWGCSALRFIGCALVIAGLPPLSGFIAKFALLAAALIRQKCTGRRRPWQWMGTPGGPDPLRLCDAGCDDASGHPLFLGLAGSRRAARARDRDGASHVPLDPLRGTNRTSRTSHALHAGHSAIAAHAGRLHPRRPGPSGQSTRKAGGI